MPPTLQGFKAELFKALAHPARIRILEILRLGETTVSSLQAQLEMESSTVSQQLALLRARDIVTGRKQGTSVYYSVVDPLIFDLLDVARGIFNNHLVDLQTAAVVDDDATVSKPGVRPPSRVTWSRAAPRHDAGTPIVMFLPVLLYAAGALMALAFGRRALGLWGGHLLAVAGGLAGLAGALQCLLSNDVERLTLGAPVPFATLSFRLDALSAFFLILISLVAVQRRSTRPAISRMATARRGDSAWRSTASSPR